MSANSNRNSHLHQLKQTVQSGTLSPFAFASFLDYQKQRRVRYGSETR